MGPKGTKGAATTPSEASKKEVAKHKKLIMLLAEIFIALLLLVVAGIAAEHYTAVTKGAEAPPEAPPAVPPTRGKGRARKEKAPPQVKGSEQEPKAKRDGGKQRGTPREAQKGKKAKVPAAKDARDEDTAAATEASETGGAATWIFSPGAHLLHAAGEALWLYAKPYRYYIRIVLGIKLDEAVTISVLSLACNVIYSLAIAVGFVTLPSQFMLRITTATIVFGPACVLVGIALIGAGFAVAAFYPSAFVFAVWLIVLAKAHLGQRILAAMGLDLDGDGDVDWSDMVELFATTPFGRILGVPHLHEHLSGSPSSTNVVASPKAASIQRRTQICKDKAGVAAALCSLVAKEAAAAIKNKGSASIAVAGGSLLDSLSNLTQHKEVDWSKVTLCFVNHKTISPADESSTSAKAKAKFASKAGITKIIEPTAKPGRHSDGTKEAAEYATALKGALPVTKEGYPVIDLVLLGLGADGHCGSNHPSSAAAINADKLAVAASPGDPSSITMTLETINAAKSVMFVVVGGANGKKEAVARALKRPAESPRGTFPAQGIFSPLFVLDEEAAAGLETGLK